jgi:hypothetical protein
LERQVQLLTELLLLILAFYFLSFRVRLATGARLASRLSGLSG